MLNKETISPEIPTQPSDSLKQLAREISGKYGIDSHTAEKFLGNTAHISLEELKAEITNKGEYLSETKLSELQSIINGYRDILKQHSKLARETLKTTLESNNNQGTKSLGEITLQRYAPLLSSRIQNPKNISDHITGAIAGIGVSTITLLDLCYRIGKGIITSPKDIYDIVTEKGVYENWKRV